MELLLALLALLGNCGWLVSGRKYRQEVRNAKVEAELKEFDLSSQYVKEFKENIYVPLQVEVHKLRTAIEAVKSCPHRDDCPVVGQLHNAKPTPTLSHREGDGQGVVAPSELSHRGGNHHD